jgi:hypothetical protein
MDAGHSDSSGSMDITQHRKTWEGFVRFIVWSLSGIGVAMILLAIFRTHQ